MKRIIITFLLFTGFSGPMLNAEEIRNNQIPDVSIGINANFGTFDMYSDKMELENKPGLYTGGGITIEKMLTGLFGIGSGIQYRYFNTDFVMPDAVPEFDATWTFQSINIPFYMILTLSGGETSLNLAAGVVYSHIFYSKMKADTSVPLAVYEDNVLRLTETNQIGLTAGIIFKVKATQYTDFMFGVMGEYYPTNVLYNAGHSKDKLNMINYSFTTGYMFRTNIFPPSIKSE
jgi:hypothetical protein